MNQQILFLVDGTALAYRSHFAFIRNPLTNSRGQNVSAIYGYINSLLRILDGEEPSHCAVAFDTPEPTFRHDRYPKYKATREKTPDELAEQFPLIKDITGHLGLTVLEVPGWEADDVIGTLAVRAAQEDMQVFLVTGDKDFMQLVSDRIKIYSLARADADAVILGIPEVEDKFGVKPDRVIEVMGLMGDASDNIPGIPGVGEKTAVKLIREFGSIRDLYENLDRVTGKSLKKKLEENRELAQLSRELVTIDREVPTDLGMQDLKMRPKDEGKLREVLVDLEFNSLLQRFSGGKSHGEDPSFEHRYVLVDTRARYESLMKALRRAPFLVIDLETTSLNPRSARIVGISLSIKEGEAFYLAANLEKPLFGDRARDLERYLKDLAEVLADPNVEICGQNIKYDLMVLAQAGIREVNRVTFDTMVAHYLLYPESAQHNLDFLSLKYLDVKKIPTAALIGKGKNQISMAQVPVRQVSEYACQDADMTHRLKTIFEKELEDQGLLPLFRDVEMPLVRVLEHMELNGVRLDKKMLREMSIDLKDRLEALGEEIYELAGQRFNINSTQQLGKVLFEKLALHKELGMKRLRKTKTGYSTNAAVLESMSTHPLPRALLEYRQLKKLQSTYVEALPGLVDPTTGRIHASFNQTVTATGRLSSSEPNLQNIPVRTEVGRKIRNAFIPREDDWVLLSADYSQIELRILAHVSEDDALLQAFKKGEDIHRGTAALIFKVDPEAVTPEMRSRAKTINFGIIYGMGPQRLSGEIGISFGEAQAFISAYFEAFAGVKGYIDRTLDEARGRGFVSTLLGRKRRIDEIQDPNQQIRSAAENVAINTPIQGTAADLIKKAMVDIHRDLLKKKLKSAMILQVHDELVFDVPPEELDTMKTLVRERMEGALALKVPIVVDMGVGRTWLEAH